MQKRFLAVVVVIFVPSFSSGLEAEELYKIGTDCKDAWGIAVMKRSSSKEIPCLLLYIRYAMKSLLNILEKIESRNF
ncbi:hypothetical protein ACH5RR_006372 [Cinchona calisaya]|uniref:Uncharacterized protein n=1 Tax=Cinchona calisaya TaxID=153742 RepID=A0ABD3AP45_9GENT